MDSDDLPVVHITDYLGRLPAARTALEEYRRGADSGAENPSPAKRGREVGDRRTFDVYNHVRSRNAADPSFDEIEFVLSAIDDRFRIWTEAAELQNGHVRERDVGALHKALAERTPSASIDPSQGIVANNERIFGRPTDVDADGKIDVLLLDVRDGWEPGSSSGYVAGFVWPGDLGDSGNAADIVYLDTYPGLYRGGGHLSTEGVERTFAHEHQHLIHFRHDPKEKTFVNEGLSEWASLANGYGARRMRYLEEPDEHTTALFAWRSGGKIGFDYERAGLFTAYLAERIGVVDTGRIAGDGASTGVDGYRAVLSPHGLSFEDVLVDFHVTNLVNGSGPDNRYAYHRDELSHVSATATHPLSESTGSASFADLTLNAGSVRYFAWSGVSDLEAVIDISESIPPSLAERMRTRTSLRAIIENPSGYPSVELLALGPDTLRFTGAADGISLVVVHHAPEAYGVRIDVETMWQSASGPVTAFSDEVPETLSLSQNYPNPFNPRTRVRYSIADGGHVRLAVFDALARRVAVVVDGFSAAGEHVIEVDASHWPAGTYYYVLEAAGERLSRSMTLVK